jgi:hypothetical protein
MKKGAMMSIEHDDPVFFSPSNGRHQPELMVSAVLHLMSHYTARSSDSGACVKLASVIERHFKALAALPELAPVLRATCQQLSEQWAGIVERDMPRPKKNNFLNRIIACAKAGKADADGFPAAKDETAPVETSAWATRHV